MGRASVKEDEEETITRYRISGWDRIGWDWASVAVVWNSSLVVNCAGDMSFLCSTDTYVDAPFIPVQLPLTTRRAATKDRSKGTATKCFSSKVGAIKLSL